MLYVYLNKHIKMLYFIIYSLFVYVILYYLLIIVFAFIYICYKYIDRYN